MAVEWRPGDRGRTVQTSSLSRTGGIAVQIVRANYPGKCSRGRCDNVIRPGDLHGAAAALRFCLDCLQPASRVERGG